MFQNDKFTQLYSISDGRVILSNDADITTRGKTFQMLCRTEDEDLDGWYDKQGEKIISDAIFDKLYIQTRGRNAQTLFIQDVKVADGGNYTCKGTKNSRNFELYVECKYLLIANSLIRGTFSGGCRECMSSLFSNSSKGLVFPYIFQLYVVVNPPSWQTIPDPAVDFISELGSI